jgi:hypothetical protein
MGEPFGYDPCGKLIHSVKTGEMAFNRTFDTAFFDYLAKHPEMGRRFD